MPIRHAAIGTTLLVLTIGSLAGCAPHGQGANESNTQALRAAPSGAAKGSGSHLDRAGMVNALTVVQMKAGSAHLSMRLTGTLTVSAEGDVSYSGSSPEMSMTMDVPQLGSKKLTMRYVDEIVYMSIPGATPAGKFLKIDPKQTQNPLSKSFGHLSDQMDPMRSFRAMESGIRSVTFLDSQPVAGTPTDHYRVAVATKPLLKAMHQQSVPGMPARLVYQVWLDGKDLIRQMKFAVMGSRTTMRVSRWGKPVHVQAPPANQVVDPATLSRKPA